VDVYRDSRCSFNGLMFVVFFVWKFWLFCRYCVVWLVDLVRMCIDVDVRVVEYMFSDVVFWMCEF